MKKLWPYIATFFIGLSAGIVIAVKWLNERVVYKGTVRIKQRGKGNIQEPSIRAEITPETKREGKKQAKIIKRNERKSRRSLRRLEKST
jgi:hypothetical protein